MRGVEDEDVPVNITRDYSFFNPKAGVSYQISAAHRVYASYARASKEPTRADFTDSPVAPRPEYLDDFEFGYGFTSSRFDASANVYYMNYLDQLVPTGELNDGSYAIQMNVDKSYRLGIELQAEYRPVKWFTWSLNATFSDNVIKGLEFSDGTRKDTKISYSPGILFNNLLTFRPLEAMTVAFSSRYVGEQYMSNNNIPESKLDGYFVSDLAINYDVPKSRYLPAFTVRGQLNNVFNAMYISNGAHLRHGRLLLPPGRDQLHARGGHPVLTDGIPIFSVYLPVENTGKNEKTVGIHPKAHRTASRDCRSHRLGFS